MNRHPSVIAAPLSILTIASLGFGQSVPVRTEREILVPPGAQGQDAFGYRVEADGELLAVHAPEDDTPSQSGGTVHIYRRLSPGVWQHQGEFGGRGGTILADEFGSYSGTLSLSGALFGGASGPTAGGATTGISFTRRLANGTFSSGAFFSPSETYSGTPFTSLTSYALDGNALYTLGLHGGSTLVIRRYTNNGAEVFALNATIGTNGIAVFPVKGSSDLVVVVNSSNFSANIYQFAGGSLTNVESILPLSGQVSGGIGSRIDAVGDLLAVGDPNFRTGGGSTPTDGRVLVYRRFGGATDWNLDEIIRAPGPLAVGRFGEDFAFSDSNTLVIGEPGRNTVYVYRFNPASDNWEHELTLVPSTTDTGADFGGRLAVSGDDLFVGRPAHESAAYSAGSVYRYSIATPDCDDNGINDLADIAGGAADCNGNGVLDSCELAQSSWLCADVVFLMDTSGSMDDEALALCGSVQQLVDELQSEGISINATILGITAAPGGAYSCLSDTVASRFGLIVPGGGLLDSDEDWAAATSIVAERFPWQSGTRVIIPISDEGPQDGDPCNDPGDDRNAIVNAISIANANGVVVSPIAGTGALPCVTMLMQELATGANGSFFQSVDPANDLAGVIFAQLQGLAVSNDCNANGILDECEIVAGSVQDCDGNGRSDVCEVLAGCAWDCDGDKTPDQCQSLYVFESTPNLAPIGIGAAQSSTLVGLEPAAGLVTITVEAVGDFSAITEYLDVSLNGSNLGRLFLNDGHDCPATPDVGVFSLTENQFNLLAPAGSAMFSFVASSAVNPTVCPGGSFVRARIEYQARTLSDCDGNGVPDLCDILIGGAPDLNGNLVLDSCEGGRPPCLGDANGDHAVDFEDVTSVLQYWSQLGPAYRSGDGSGDGAVDFADITCILTNWGFACP